MNESSRKTKMLRFLMALGIAMSLPFSMAGQPPPGNDTEPSFVPNEPIILLDHGASVPAPEEVVTAVNERRPVPGLGAVLPYKSYDVLLQVIGGDGHVEE